MVSGPSGQSRAPHELSGASVPASRGPLREKVKTALQGAASPSLKSGPTAESTKINNTTAVEEIRKGIVGSVRLVSRAYATATLPLALPLALGMAAAFGPQLRKVTNKEFNDAVDTLGDHATGNPLIGAGKAAKILAIALTVGGIKEDAKDALGIFRACGIGIQAAFSKGARASAPLRNEIVNYKYQLPDEAKATYERITQSDEYLKSLNIDEINSFNPEVIFALTDQQFNMMIEGKNVHSQAVTARLEATSIAPEGKTKFTGGRVPEGTPITLNRDIKVVENMRLANMTITCTILIMDKTDFENIYNTIHENAFGSDYMALPNGTVAVWKIPRDLFEIDSYQPSAALTVAVGTYPTLSEEHGVGARPNQDLGTYTKLRIDNPRKPGGSIVESLHVLESVPKTADETPTQLPALSVGYFKSITQATTASERVKFQELGSKLREKGIPVTFALDSQHLLVFHEKQEDASRPNLTPQAFADKLASNKEEIVKLLQEYATDAVAKNKIAAWVDAYIEQYGTKS